MNKYAYHLTFQITFTNMNNSLLHFEVIIQDDSKEISESLIECARNDAIDQICKAYNVDSEAITAVLVSVVRAIKD